VWGGGRGWLAPVVNALYPTVHMIERMAKDAEFELTSTVLRPVTQESCGPLRVYGQDNADVRQCLALVARRPG